MLHNARSIGKNQLYLRYTSNEHSKNEIKKQSHNNIKKSETGRDLTKEVQDLYTENYRIKKELNK